MTEALHTICGLPRSGSTLLCNVLAQNPRFRVTSTSPLVGTLTAMQNRWSNCPEIQSALIADREGTLERLRSALLAVAGELVGNGSPVLFDKCRLWNSSLRLFQWLAPTGKMVVVVRDLRAIFGSMEKQHAKTAVFEFADNPLKRSLMSRSNQTFSDVGAVGRDLAGVHDLMRRARPTASDCVYFLRYEDFVRRPKHELRALYEELGEDYYEHDVDNVVNVSKDVDEVYYLKFPHVGEGKIGTRVDDWRDWVSPDLSQQILSAHAAYNKQFRYE